jgi:hypothetical protein
MDYASLTQPIKTRRLRAVQRHDLKGENIVAARVAQKAQALGKPAFTKTKKEPPSPAAQSHNREASNRVDRSHSVSRKMDRTP